MRLRQLFEIIGIYVSWIKSSRTFPVWNWVKAAYWYRHGQFERAAIEYEAGIFSNPNHSARVSAQLDLAFCMFNQSKISDAEKELKKIIEAEPTHQEAYKRLGLLQLWSGRPVESALTFRSVCQHCSPTSELIGYFLISALESRGSLTMLDEATKLTSRTHIEFEECLVLQTALAILVAYRGDKDRAIEALFEISEKIDAPAEAFIAAGDILLQYSDTVLAKDIIIAGLRRFPTHPCLLSLRARLYLKAGEEFNPEFAVQLATKACQNGQWLSTRDLHVLAESYYHTGDRDQALIIACKARRVGAQRHGNSIYDKYLDRLIESLS